MMKVAKVSDNFEMPASTGFRAPIMNVAAITKGVEIAAGGKSDDLTNVAWASADRLLVCLYLRGWRLQCGLRATGKAGKQPLASWSSPLAGKKNLGQNARSPPSGGSLSPASSCHIPTTRNLQPSSSIGSLSFDFNASHDPLVRTAASPSVSSAARGPRPEALSTLSLSPSPTSAKSDRIFQDLGFAAESTSASSFAYSRAQLPTSWGSPVRKVPSSPQSQVEAFGGMKQPPWFPQGYGYVRPDLGARPVGEHARSVKLWCLRSWQIAVFAESQSRTSAESTALRGKLCLLEAEHAKTLREAAGRQKAATELLEKHKDLAHNQALCHVEVVEAMRARESRMHSHKWRTSEDGTLRMRWALSTWQAHVISRRGRVRCTMLHATLNEFQDTADNELILVVMFLHWALGARDVRAERLVKEQKHLQSRVNEMNNILMSQVKKFDIMSEQWEMEKQDSLGHIMRWRDRAIKAEDMLREDRALMIARNDRTLLMREKLGPCFFSWAYITQMGRLGLRSTHSVYGYLAEDPYSPTYRTAEPGSFAMVTSVQTHREIATQFAERVEHECQTEGPVLPKELEDRNHLQYHFWSGPTNGSCRDAYVQVVEMVPALIQADPKTAKLKKRVSIAVDSEGKKVLPSGEHADSEAISTEDDGAGDDDDDDDDEFGSEEASADVATLDTMRAYLEYAKASLVALNEQLVKQWDVAQEKTHETCLYMLTQRDALKLELLFHTVFKSWFSHVRDKQVVKRMQSMVQKQRLTVSWDKRCCFNFWVQALRFEKMELFKAGKLVRGIMVRTIAMIVQDWCIFWFLLFRWMNTRNTAFKLMSKGICERDDASDMHLVFLKWQSTCQVYGRALEDQEADLSLRFPDAPWPPPPRFKFKLRESIKQAGAEGFEDLEITLREGVAIARGASEDVTKAEEGLQKLESLEKVEVVTETGTYKLAKIRNSNAPPTPEPSPSPAPSKAGSDREAVLQAMRGSLSLPPDGNLDASRRTSQASMASLTPSQAGEESGEKLEEFVKNAVKEIMGAAIVEALGKNKFKINGTDHTIIVKSEKALVRKGASWIPIEKALGSSPAASNAESATPSRASTPRSVASGAKAGSKAGSQRGSYSANASKATSKAGLPPKSPAKAKAKR